MHNSRDCHMVVTDRDSIFGMGVALRQAINEKSPKSENVAMYPENVGLWTIQLLFVPKD